jgi:hypothetical protein
MTTRVKEKTKLEIDKALGGTKDHESDTQSRKKEVKNEKNYGLSHHNVRSCVLFHSK